MFKGAKVLVSPVIVLGLLALTTPGTVTASTGTGQLVGFVFGPDGTTPVAGAVVTLKNVSNGTAVDSAKSDPLGAFRMTGLERGLYALGVSSVQGRFNAADVVGISPSETTKVSIALVPFETAIAPAAQQVVQEQKQDGESRVGRVVRYLPATQQAEVFIDRGLLQTDDRIHVKTENRKDLTDFRQNARVLIFNGVQVKRLLVGQTGLIPVNKPCLPEDLVYVSCKRGVPPIFLLPLGIATVGFIGHHDDDPPDSSPSTVKR